MKLIQEILYPNYGTLCLIVGLLIIALRNKAFARNVNQYFILYILTVLALDLCDMAEYYILFSDTMGSLRHVTAALGYALRPVVPALIINILNRRHRLNQTIWALAAVNGALSLTSPFTHLYFWYEGEGAMNYHGGPLGSVPFYLSTVYIAVLLYFLIKNSAGTDVGEALVIIFIMVTNIFAMIVGIEEAPEISKYMLPSSMIVSCTVYYIYMYTEVYKRDPLTGLFNRKSCYLHAEGFKSTGFAVVSIDLNDLKKVNDTQGHHAGDTALKAIADALLRAGKRGFRVYRIGGDEFIALGKRKTFEDAKQFIDDAKEALAQTSYMASFGRSMFRPGDNIDEVFNKADEDMYSDKRTYHHRTGPR